MRIHTFLPLCAVCLMAVLPVFADTPPAIDLRVAAPQTPLATVAANLAQQTGTDILVDTTVTALVGPADFQGGNVGEVLTKLQASVPGLTWHKVYLPKDAALPTADALSRQIHALEAITATGLVIASPTDSIDFSHHADSAVTPPVGMHPVYLVTTSNAPAAAPATPGAAPANAVQQTADGMKDVANEFGTMSPQQQQAVLPLMFMQFQRIMQTMDPSVRAGLGQMFQQMQQNNPGFNGQGQNGQDPNGQGMGNGQDQNGPDMGNGQ